MALPAANLVQAALEQLYAAAAADKTQPGARKLVSLLNEMSGVLNRLYSVHVGADVTITADATDAGVSEFIGGGDGDALAVGDVFRKLGTAADDLTDNAFATAKGSALAAGDVFCVDGADSVEYMGSQTDLTKTIRVFDFSGEKESDFDSIGS